MAGIVRTAGQEAEGKMMDDYSDLVEFPAVVGIDPGKSGFLCCMIEDGMGGLEFCPVPVIRPKKGKTEYNDIYMADILRDWAGKHRIQVVALEAQQAYPGQGGTSNFTTGMGYGIWRGIVATLRLPLICVHPKTWQKEMFVGVSGKDPKARSIQAAGRLFPDVDLRATEHPLAKPHNGKSDSLLIAEWARRSIIGRDAKTP